MSDCNRPEGDITDDTGFVCRLNKDMENVVCNAISNGDYKHVRWGDNKFVKDWTLGNRHDPRSEFSLRIRRLIRLSNGITQKEIIFITGIERDLCSALLRELDKMDLYDTFPPPPATLNIILT